MHDFTRAANIQERNGVILVMMILSDMLQPFTKTLRKRFISGTDHSTRVEEEII
jgi:hypothetical protein